MYEQVRDRNAIDHMHVLILQLLVWTSKIDAPMVFIFGAAEAIYLHVKRQKNSQRQQSRLSLIFYNLPNSLCGAL